MTDTPARGEGAQAHRFLGHTLPVGTRIGNFEITGLIGEGGFGIVYLAYDASLQRQVALKEYMPSSLASRANDSNDISVKSDRYAETFAAGLKSFVNEARLLARFDHPSLVKVYQFFEANHTAYMAMPYYEGPTLKCALAELSQPPDEATLREWLRPLLSALAAMHKEHCWHRDIAPDNILLTPSGPLLLDFGAARRVIGDMTHALTVVLKPGYAPIEQYGEAASMAQGPWTDLYALASVVYYAITGKPPTTSVERVMGDEMATLSDKAGGRYSAGFIAAIDATLAVRPKDRPQDVAAFCELLNQGLEADHPARFRASGFHSIGFETLAPSIQPAGVRPAPQPVTRSVSSAVTRGVAPSVTRGELPPGDAQPTVLLPAEAAIQPMLTRAPVPITEPSPALAPAAEPFALGLPSALQAPSAPAAGEVPSSAAATRRGPPVLAIAALGVLLVAALAYYFGNHFGNRLESAPTPPAVAPVAAPQAAPTVAPAAPPAMATIDAPITLPSASAGTKPPAAAEAAQAVAPAPNETAPIAPRPATPARRDDKKAAPPAAAPPRIDAPPKNAGVKPARCSDILQKASLEPISREEAEYLRRECR